MRNLTVSMLFLFLTISPAYAVGVGVHRWSGSGSGNNPCAYFLHAMSTTEPTHTLSWRLNTYFPESVVYMQWINGYIAGVNATNKPGSKPVTTDDGKLETWVRRYCGKHPDTPLKDAVGEFVKSQRSD